MSPISAIDDAIVRLRLSAKPVLVETGLEDAPYAGAGTCFLTKLGHRLFLLTARHVVDGCSLDDLLVFPNVETNESIPFSAGFTVQNRDPSDPDFSDIVIVQIAVNQVQLADQSLMHAIDLEKASDSWRTNPFDHRFIIFGYPNANRSVDYKKFSIASTQNLLVARFGGESPASHCFELVVEDFNGVEDLNGLSGSPVVSWPRVIGAHFHPSFCGMILRGTKESGRMHFLDAKVLRRALELAKDT